MQELDDPLIFTAFIMLDADDKFVRHLSELGKGNSK